MKKLRLPLITLCVVACNSVFIPNIARYMIDGIKNKEISIIAGPCSVNENNIYELYQLAGMEVTGSNGGLQRALTGIRVVGLKSRTTYKPGARELGIDYQSYMLNLEELRKGSSIHELKMMPSIELAYTLALETGIMIATEIVSPLIQAPLYQRLLGDFNVLVWNPAVMQLGWNLPETVKFMNRKKWFLGLKNPKWTGRKRMDSLTQTELNGMEKTWIGMRSYAAGVEDRVIFIQRGVSSPDSGMYRNMPLHESSKKVKQLTGSKMFFDPSHSYGPKLRDKIVEGTIEAMKMMVSENEYLYDGILIEAGTSFTDSAQHITLDEMKYLASSLAEFRKLATPQYKKVTGISGGTGLDA